MEGKNSAKRKKNVYSKMKREEDDDKKTKKLTRFLITVKVLGSAGPLKFLVNDDDLVSDVIHTALKSYARQGRLPLLGSDSNNFLLYHCPQLDVLSPTEAIGCCGARNFKLVKKKEANVVAVRETRITVKDETQKQNRLWNSKWKSCILSSNKKPFLRLRKVFGIPIL